MLEGKNLKEKADKS